MQSFAPANSSRSSYGLPSTSVMCSAHCQYQCSARLSACSNAMPHIHIYLAQFSHICSFSQTCSSLFQQCAVSHSIYTMGFLNSCSTALLRLLSFEPATEQYHNQQPLPLGDVSFHPGSGITVYPETASSGFQCQYPSMSGW